MADNHTGDFDVVLVGAGIMSMTLATFLKELQPHLKIEIVERLEGEAQESSGAWNNAGTGHAANCELNYTPQRADGSVDISKALEVNVEFDMSRQFWSYLIKKGAIARARLLHPSRAAHELRDRRRSRGLPEEAPCRDERPSLLPRHGIFRGPQADRRMGAADHGGPRSRPARRRHAHGDGRRRELRRAHHQPAELPATPGRLLDRILAGSDRPSSPHGRRLDASRSRTRRPTSSGRSARATSSWAPAARR